MARNRGRRRWLRWGIILLSAVLLLFCGLQGVLATPWARHQVAGRIGERIGLETRISRLSWSPWEGATVHGLTVAKPEGLDERPLLDVAKVRVWPDYGAWIQGRREVRGVEVIDPQLELDVGLLLSLASRLLPDEAPEPPALAAVEPRPAPGAPTGAGPETTSPPSVAVVPEPRPQPAPQAPVAGPGKEATGWLTIRGAGCRVVMPAGGGDLLRLEGLEGALPISGAGSGRISGRCDSDFSGDLGRDLSLRVQTPAKGPSEIDFRISGKKMEIAVIQKLGKKNGRPFQARVSVAVREAIGWRLAEDWSGTVRPTEGRLEAFGWLLYPNSWNVRGGWRSTGVEVAAGGWRMDFDRVSGNVVLAGGRLQCPDFRLLGSSVSLLGNGWLGSAGGAAVVRVTLPPDWAEGVGKQLGGVAWRPLSPGDWLYADLTLWLDEDGSWRIELGEEGSVMDWNEWKACLSGGPSLGR